MSLAELELLAAARVVLDTVDVADLSPFSPCVLRLEVAVLRLEEQHAFELPTVDLPALLRPQAG